MSNQKEIMDVEHSLKWNGIGDFKKYFCQYNSQVQILQSVEIEKKYICHLYRWIFVSKYNTIKKYLSRVSLLKIFVLFILQNQHKILI